MSDHKFLAALDSMDEELSKPFIQDLNGNGLCAIYKKIRGSLEAILPVVKVIPVYGPKLAAAIQFLMTVADTVCPA